MSAPLYDDTQIFSHGQVFSYESDTQQPADGMQPYAQVHIPSDRQLRVSDNLRAGLSRCQAVCFPIVELAVARGPVMSGDPHPYAQSRPPLFAWRPRPWA